MKLNFNKILHQNFVVLLGALACAAAQSLFSIAHAQDTCNGASDLPLNLRYNSIDASGFPTIVSYVTVTNDSDLVVGQLDSSHFVVREDGFREYPIDVADLTGNNEAVTVVLVMDRSGSMDESNLMDGAIGAAAEFIGLLAGQDYAGLVSFGSDVRIDHDISIDKNSVIGAIEALRSGGGTRLYDGVYEAAKLLNSNQATTRKALVVMSDGHSKEDSDIAFDEMTNLVQAMGFPVYTIGLKERGGTIEENLINLACRTGGKYYYSPQTDDLQEIYEAIVEMLRHQYRITYTTHNPARDGSRRQVEITVNALANTASDTNSYLAPLDLVTLSPVSNDTPVPGRTFEVRVVIPDSSFPAYEMQDLQFILKFDPQYLSVSQPVDQSVQAGALWGAAGQHSLNFTVDAGRGEITFTLTKDAAAGLINGKGELARVVFQASQSLPDNIPLTFFLSGVVAENGDANPIRTQVTSLTLYSFGYITLSVKADGVLQPGRPFTVVIEIPESGKSLPEMRDLALMLEYDQAYLRLVQQSDQAVQKLQLLQPADESALVYQSNEATSNVAISANKKPGQAAMRGRGGLLSVTFDVSVNTPDSTAFAFELASVLGRDDAQWEIPFKIENLYIASNGLAVWPGDTDHNGVVELQDVLPLGVHWTLSGPGRPDEPDPTNWIAQLAQRYPVPTAAHADADGSGHIDERDIVPVGLNWGKSTASAISFKVSQAAQSYAVSGKLWSEIRATDLPGKYECSLYFEAHTDVPLSGATFQLALANSSLKITEVRPGVAWLEAPLLFNHYDATAHRLAIGMMAKSNSRTIQKGGELVKIYFESENEVEVADYAFEYVALVTPDGHAHDMDVVSANGTFDELPIDFQLFPAFPNPFNPNTTLRYALPDAATVDIAIFDAVGREVALKTMNHDRSGLFSWQWDGVDQNGDLAGSGLYIVRITARTADGWLWRARQKITLMK